MRACWPRHNRRKRQRSARKQRPRPPPTHSRPPNSGASVPYEAGTLPSMHGGGERYRPPVTVKFSGTEDSSLQTSFVIDDTALNAG